jgi:hypothetical protein
MSAARKTECWLTSKQVEKQLHIDSCELMHLREQGNFRFCKKGNAFMYAKTDVLRLKKSARPT